MGFVELLVSNDVISVRCEELDTNFLNLILSPSYTTGKVLYDRSNYITLSGGSLGSCVDEERS
jgi:hypothetical protein